MQSHLRLGVFIVFLLCACPAFAGEKINQYLPKFLKADVEFRHRLEFRDNFDFNDSRQDRDTFDLLRTRLNLQWLPVKNWKLFT